MNLIESTPEESTLKLKLESDNQPNLSEIQYQQQTLFELVNHMQDLKVEKKRVAKINLINAIQKNYDVEPLKVNNEILTTLQNDKQKVLSLNTKYQDQFKRAGQVINNSLAKLQDYKRDIDKLQPDSDGIYIIIKGEGRVINPFDNQRLLKLAVGDYFGGSKFLKEQRYSYFGDVVASSSSSKQSIDKRSTIVGK